MAIKSPNIAKRASTYGANMSPSPIVQTNQTQRLALTDIFKSTKGSGWKRSDNWGSRYNICSESAHAFYMHLI